MVRAINVLVNLICVVLAHIAAVASAVLVFTEDADMHLAIWFMGAACFLYLTTIPAQIQEVRRG